MSKTRRSGNNRVQVVKNVGCQECGNNKVHHSGIRAWCTKCKHEIMNPEKK